MEKSRRHFTEAERMLLEAGVKAGRSIEEIARNLCKHRTSVCRELMRNRTWGPMGLDDSACPMLEAPPYVCNACEHVNHCQKRRCLYMANRAHEHSQDVLVSSRAGFNLTDGELAEIDTLVRNGTGKGQSLHHILMAHRDEIQVSEKTLYRLVNADMLTVKRHHMPEAPYRKPRAGKLKKRTSRIDRKYQDGRRIDDFRLYMARHPGTDVVEIDSVVGPKGSSKVLLTINLNSCGLMLAYIRDANTAQSVVDVFNGLETRLGLDRFRKLFPVILTDNGGEFSRPDQIETNELGQSRTRFFYCHPYSASEKPHVENNHENLRKIIAKHVSFDRLAQEDVDLAVCHVNSMIRKGYDNKAAIDRFIELYGQRAARCLKLVKIPADSVCLKPELVGLGRKR